MSAQAVPCLADVSVLRGIELTSFKLILAVALLAVLTAVIAAVLLPRTVPAATREKTADGPARPALRTVLRGVGRYTARTVMVSVPVLLVMVLAGLLINCRRRHRGGLSTNPGRLARHAPAEGLRLRRRPGLGLEGVLPRRRRRLSGGHLDRSGQRHHPAGARHRAVGLQA